MTPKENLHYAIGLLAFSMAKADGEVQKAERQRFHDMVAAALRDSDPDCDISGIIFDVMDKDRSSTEDTYKWAMKQIRVNSHYMSPKMKRSFLKVMEKIAEAYPPVTVEEQKLIDRFKRDIAPLNGDPLFYAPMKYKNPSF